MFSRAITLSFVIIATSVLVLCHAQSPDEHAQPPGQHTPQADPLPAHAILRMGTTRLSHEVWLKALQFSPNDQLLASADHNGMVRLWAVADGKMIWQKESFGTALAFAPDGKTLAICGMYGQGTTLWDLENNEVKLEIPTSKDSPFSAHNRAICYCDDGRLLAIARGNSIEVRDSSNGKLLRHLDGHPHELETLAYSPESNVLAAAGGDSRGGDDATVTLWNVNTGEKLCELLDDNQRFQKLPGTVYSLSFSADGKTLGSAGPYVARLWDIDRQRLLHRIDDGAKSISFAPKKSKVALAGKFGVYDTNTATRVLPIDADIGASSIVTYSNDGTMIASSNAKGRIQFWDAQTGGEIDRRWGHKGDVESAAFSPDGRLAVSVSREDATIRVWGTVSGKQLKKIPLRFTGQDVWWNSEGRGLTIAPHGEFLLWTSDSTMHSWSLNTLKKRSQRYGKSRCTNIAVDHTASQIAIVEYGSSRSPISVYNMDDGKLVAAIKPDYDSSGEGISSIAFSSDGNALAVGIASKRYDNAENTVTLWDLASGKPKASFRVSPSAPGKILFSPDGRLVATSASGKTPLQIWRTTVFDEAHAFKVVGDSHGREQVGLAFSPDSKLLAAANANHEIYVWELATRKKIRTLKGHQNAVTSLSFSPDGTQLLSSSRDQTLMLWSVRNKDQKVAERLTQQQLMQYWDALSDANAQVAREASNVMLNSPNMTLGILQKHLNAGKKRELSALPKLIGDLCGSDIRSQLLATAELKSYGESATPALMTELRAQADRSVCARIESVLETIGKFPVPAETLQRSRAVELLEQMGTLRAKKLLRELASSQPATDISQQAKAAIRRLTQRDSSRTRGDAR